MNPVELAAKIKKNQDHLKSQFGGLQIGRANVSIVDSIQVESYGQRIPLNQVANISCPDSKTIRIEPWDKSQLGEIKKGIDLAEIGINPQEMGDYILLPIPPLTEERRKEVAKRVSEMGEQAKVSLRHARREIIDSIKKQKEDNEISEDEQKKQTTEAQKIIDTANHEIENLTKNKINEVETI